MQGMDRWSKQYLDNTLGMNYCLTAGATRHPKAQCQDSGIFWGLGDTVYPVLTPGAWWLAGVCGLQRDCSNLFLHPPSVRGWHTRALTK